VVKEIEVRYEKQGKHFEILVNDKVFDYLEGKGKIEDCFIVEEVFRDVKKGDKASENDLNSVFGTTNFKKIAEIMIKEGNIQIPTEYRRKKIKEKRKQIISIISRNSIDPRTKLPIPPQRIELAMEQVRVKIDPFKSAEKQAEEIVKKLITVLPIKFEKVKIAIKIPAIYIGKAYSFVKKEAVILNEDYDVEGNWIVAVEIPGGYKVEFIDKLAKITKGEIQVKDLK